MKKSPIDYKEIQRFIIESRENGKTDQEIYNELAPKYYDKKTLALLIRGTVTKERKEKYKRLNGLLLTLIGIAIVFEILWIIAFSITYSSFWLLIGIFIIPLFGVFLFYQVYRYNAIAYQMVGILGIIIFMRAFQLTDGHWLAIIISILLGGGITFLGFYVKNKLIPGYKPRKLKKDADGEYILDSQT